MRSIDIARAAALALSLLAFAACGDSDSDPIAAPNTPTVTPTPTITPTPTSTPTLDPNPPLVLGEAQGRPAEVVLPADYDIEERYPLVLLLHGFGANARAQDFIFGLANHTTEFQFILVLPNGTMNAEGDRFWNGTQECCQFGETPVDDVGYLAGLMREAMATYAVDPERIRLAGHSNGGYMSYRYACEQPVPVDRIAVLAGSTYLDAADCRDPQPIDVLHMHGTNDDTIRYEPHDGPGVRTIGADAAIGRWAQRAGCHPEPQLVERRDHHRVVRDGDDPAETEVLRYDGCGGETIELWRAVNGDHIYLSVNDLWRDEVAAFLSE